MDTPEYESRVVFDVYCENSDGEKFLADMSTFKVIYDKLTFIYLKIPKFLKHEDELETVAFLLPEVFFKKSSILHSKDCCGRWTRTIGLLVMSQASCLSALFRDI